MMNQDNQVNKDKTHSILMRKSSAQKMVLKEKIVQIYEAFFHVSSYYY